MIKNLLFLFQGFIILSLTGACQQRFDNGQEGRLPQGWNVDDYAVWHADGRLPGTLPGFPLECNNTWDLGSQAIQQVESCEGYDFTDLYGQAVSDGEAMAAEVQCQGECHDDRPQTQVSWSALWCSGNEASAQVMMSYLCRRFEDDQFPLGERIPRDFTPDPVPTLPGARPAPWPVEFNSTARPAEVACGSAKNVELRYEKSEREFACSSFDIDGLRNSARTRAEWMYGRYQCASACAKTPIEIHQERWSCLEDNDRNGNGKPDRAQATITVHFSVECESN